MRIRTIKIVQWRHFQNIELTLENDSPLVCIIGANGTGKSHLLELIASCAHRLGLAPGTEIPRGDPFSDPHDFSLSFYLATGVSEAIENRLVREINFSKWNRTLIIHSKNIDSRSNLTRIFAGGFTDVNEGIQFAQKVVEVLRQSKDVHFLSLDADRAYPKKTVSTRDLADAYEKDWATEEYTRGRSYIRTATLYDEWLKFFMAQENQAGTRFIQGIRKTKKFNAPTPEFEDPFEVYAASLQKVLPQLLFIGVDSKQRTLLFDTTGLELSFNQLSGGEREIAFLIGQIDRFGLRQGLFLIDEPELHLNADLIRTWVAYLAGTVLEGQIWLATHSLEAVEAAGLNATFILERNEETRKVDCLDRLDSRPVLSALSRAVGTPAFSISQLRFVFVEGEEGVSERERFRKLADVPANVRFMECGSCNEVIRRVSAIKALAKETEAGIRIGGVIDRDFRSKADAEVIARENGVFVLPVHEVENLFLEPTTLANVLQQNGLIKNPYDLIRDAADGRAGSWIFQHAMATRNAKSLPEISSIAKDRLKALNWAQLSTDQLKQIKAIVELCGYQEEDTRRFEQILTISADVYAVKREKTDLWKFCEGKQVLNDVARNAGFSSAPFLSMAIFALWKRDTNQIPQEVASLRSHIASI